MLDPESNSTTDDQSSRRLFDKLCILLIVFVTLISVVRWNSLYPNFIDSYYHMAVIRAFGDSGGVVLHDYWEYAPAGRPHVYAPLVHIIGYVMYSFGVGINTVGQLISWWPYPVSFIAVWLWLRDAIGPKSAFFALALLLGPSAWFMNQTAFTANSVALVIAPLTFLAFQKEKYITAAVLSTLACYTHGSGFVVPAALLLYGIHRPKLLLKRVLPVVGASLIAFLPWAIHVYSNRNLMSLARMGGDTLMQMGSFQIFPLLMPLALAGLVLAYSRRGKALMLPSFLLAFAVMIPMGYAHRFWRFNSYLPYAVLGGFSISCFLAWLGRRFQWKQHEIGFAVGVLLLALTVDPVIGGPGGGGPGGPGAMGPGRGPGEESSQGFPLHFQPGATLQILGMSGGPGRNQLQSADVDTEALTKLVEENTEPEDIVAYGGGRGRAGGGGPMACMVTALTGRRTNSGMLREVSSEEQQEGIDDVNVLILAETSTEDKAGAGAPDGMMGPGGFGGQPGARRDAFRPQRPGMRGAGMPQSPGGMMMGPEMLDTQNPPDGFDLVAESDGTKLFRTDSAATYELPKPDPVLTLPMILLILAGLCGLVVLDLVRPRIKPVAVWAGAAALSAMCFLACIPMISEALAELADQPTRPEWLERHGPAMGPGGQGGPPMMGQGRMMPMGPQLPEDTPEDILRKHSELMGHVREETQAGRRPDGFLPREEGRRIHDLILDGEYEKARKLIDNALEEYSDSRRN